MITFSEFGKERAGRFLTGVDQACKDTADRIMHLYGWHVRLKLRERRTPTSFASSGYRDPNIGHPDESDRPTLSDVLSNIPSLGTVRKVGTAWFGMFGNLAILDKMKPMYYRNPLGVGNSPRELIVQEDKPAIWTYVEYGAPAHPIRPRSDRKVLRFRARSGDIIYRTKVNHPGAYNRLFSQQGVGAAMGKDIKGTVSKISVEPYGLAPFRTSHWLLCRMATQILHSHMLLRVRGI